MALKVIGAVNVRYVLIACNYVLAWVLAIVYLRVANTKFDPMAVNERPEEIIKPKSSA